MNPTPVSHPANTGDAGVLLYGVTALSLTGTAWLGAEQETLNRI